MGSTLFNLRPDVLARIKTALNDSSYKESLENSSQYNNRLVAERRLRLPFLDAQTGVAQSDCLLWMQKWERMPGKSDGQLYSYPSRKWCKKRRQYLMNDNYLTRKNREIETASFSEVEIPTVVTAASTSALATAHESGPVKIETAENPEKFAYDSSKDAWYQEYDDGSDLPDAGELDDPESDYDDYEEYSNRKKSAAKKKKDTQKRRRVEYSDAEKPYHCDICGARYKTRPGLSYHYSHSHQNDSMRGQMGAGVEEEQTPDSGMLYTPPRQSHPPTPASAAQGNPGQTGGTPPVVPVGQNPPPVSSNSPMPPHPLTSMDSPAPHSSASRSSAPPNSGNPTTPSSSSSSHIGKTASGRPSDEIGEGTKSSSGKPVAAPSTYCDFCLGDSIENKKTKSAEDLVSCSDCGRSAHPTCLQFTDNMTKSVKKYRWQCIECKSCGLCGTSDNDDQLLFCDDCDRGYHMYCLKPPLSEPPEGSWSCHLCIEEYHTPKSK